MHDGEISIGHHRPTFVPIALSDDVNKRDVKCVSGSNDRTNVEIMLPILNGNLQ